MVQDYELQCNYQIGTLKDKIYILPYDDTVSINYKVDNNKINVTGITYNHAYSIEGINVTLNETESYDSRFKFATTVNISIKESLYGDNLDALNQLRNNRWFVVVENHEGNQFIASVDFPMDFEYNYSFTSSSEEAHTNTLSFTGLSNIPVMILDNPIGNVNIFGLISKSCFYNIGNIKDLKICNFKNSLIKKNDNGYEFDNIITNGGESYHEVQFIKNTFSYTEQYKDNKFASTLSFSIPLSQYKYIFHYNLIEFKKNRYTIVFRTFNSNAFADGFEFGFFPSYTITTSEEITTPNTITITLKHTGETPLLVTRKNDEDIYQIDSRYNLVPIQNITDADGKVINTEVCINETQAIRTLFMEQTVTGEESDRYWCLKGYEDKYSFLNIVGTYTEEDDLGVQMIINSYKCAQDAATDCKFDVNPPSAVTLYVQGQQFQFVLKGKCDWEFSSIPSFITVSPMSGKANDNVTVTITAKENPTEDGKQGVLVTKTGNITKETLVTLQSLGDWLSPDIFNITAQKQVVSCYSTISNNDIEIVNSAGCLITFQNSVMNISVPENYEETPRVLTITVKNKLTTQTKQVIINQDKLYVEWKWLSQNDIICDGIKSYQKLTKFKGYTPSSIGIQTEEYKQGEKILDNDVRCHTNITEWRKSSETLCEGSTLYNLEEEWLSIDGGKTFNPTGKTRKAGVNENNSPKCDSRYTWVDNGSTICVGGNLYKQLEKYFNDGTEIKPTGDTKVGDLIEVQSPSCIEAEDNVIKYTFWYHNISTSQPLYNLKIQAASDFVINWGDGSSNSYLAEDYDELTVCSHTWTKATPATGNNWHEYTVQITGKILYLYLDKPETSKTTDFYYAAIDVEKGTELRRIYMNTTRLKDNSISLVNCNKLLSFEMINNIDTKGLSSFIYPSHSILEYVKIGNESYNIQSYINTSQLQKIIDDVPTYQNDRHGVIDLCYNPNDQGAEYGCSIDESPLENKNWVKSNVCCRTDGSKQYRFISTGNYTCDEQDHIKYEEMKLQYCTYNASTGYWSQWTDVTPEQLYKGDILELDSVDCGGGEPGGNVKWEVRTDLYMCEGYNSYYQEQKYVSEDGLNWVPASPEEFRKGSLKKKNDEACGYIEPIQKLYRFDTVPGEYICGNNPDNSGIPSQMGAFKMTLFKPTTVTIPFDGNALVVDWGDGTVETGVNTHTYEVPMYYQVSVSGTANSMGTIGEIGYRLNFQNSLVSIDSWGHSAAISVLSSSIAGAFSGCSLLATHADDTYGTISHVKVFAGLFSGCSSLYGNSMKIMGKYLYELDNVNLDASYCNCSSISDYNFLLENYGKMTQCI